MEGLKKKFTLSRVFDGVLNDNVEYVDCQDGEDHFDMRWSLNLSQLDGSAQLNISCDRPDPYDEEEYCIEAEYDMMVYFKDHRMGSKNQKVVFDDPDDFHQVRLMSWDLMKRSCSVKGEVKVELQFEITKMDGVTAKKKMDFDATMEEFSDAVLVVGGEKFHVLKKFLSIHSPYFKTMFFGNFKESNQSEVILQDIDPWEFQKFLEVLYGANSIDDDYCDAILRLVDMFDASNVRRQCEEFLMEKSKKSLREKLELAVEHNMQNVKEKCLNDIKSYDDIRSVVPQRLEQLDPSLMPAILGKALGIINNLLK